MSQPNFIVFLTDDQGYGDLSCMGATDFRTPHLDRLARRGGAFHRLVFQLAGVQPFARRLLTGRYPANAGVRAILAGHRTASGLPPTMPTLATRPQAAGLPPPIWPASGTWASTNGIAPTPWLRRMVRLPGRLHRLLLAHLLLGHEQTGTGHQPYPRPLGERPEVWDNGQLLHRG